MLLYQVRCPACDHILAVDALAVFSGEWKTLDGKPVIFGETDQGNVEARPAVSVDCTSCETKVALFLDVYIKEYDPEEAVPLKGPPNLSLVQ